MKERIDFSKQCFEIFLFFICEGNLEKMLVLKTEIIKERKIETDVLV